jgi:hypothetical protein
MARIVTVLICGALVFVLVSKVAPRFIETYLPSVNSDETAEASDASGSKAEQAKKKSGTTKGRPGTATRSSAARTTEPSTSLATESTSATTDKTAGQPVPVADTRSVQVTSENATVYLTNTTVGPVVGRLTKGAVVKPVFVVSSAGQNWTFVSTNNEEFAGFMRSETLGKGKAPTSAAR